MRRRTLLLSGAGALGAAVAAPYATLAVGDDFEAFVADRLGIEVAAARPLLDGARERVGDRRYDREAARFALAARGPWDALVPDDRRRDAIERFLILLMPEPAQRLAYARGTAPALACGGLQRPA